MSDFIGGSIISGIGGLAGALINQSANRKANHENQAMQKEFATEGIRMRVEDAKAAGIHPLYALGAQTYTPTIGVQASTAMGDAVANMGQNISRAMTAGTTLEEKNLQLLDAQIEHQRLQNQMLGIKIGDELYPKPSIPIPDNSDVGGMAGQRDYRGFADFPDFKSYVDWRKPSSTIRGPGSSNREFGDIGDVGLSRTKTGWTFVPGGDVKNRIEDIGIEDVAWSLRNRILPGLFNTPPAGPPAEMHVPKNHYWYYNRWTNEWQLRNKNKKYY